MDFFPQLDQVLRQIPHGHGIHHMILCMDHQQRSVGRFSSDFFLDDRSLQIMRLVQGSPCLPHQFVGFHKLALFGSLDGFHAVRAGISPMDDQLHDDVLLVFQMNPSCPLSFHLSICK